MKYEVKPTSRFRKNYMLMQERGKDMSLIDVVIAELAEGNPLSDKYHDHALKGVFQGSRECHIEPDWLLIYRRDIDVLVLTLTNTGTHSDLFE